MERTEVIYGEENVTKMTLKFANNAKERIECCLDPMALTVAVGVPEFKQAILSATKRGAKLRYITEVTKDNLAYCKEFSNLVELRHLDDVRGNFAVNEIESISTTIITQEAKPVPKAIYSNIREVVLQQEYLFDTLWKIAIPAEKRIREIEEDLTPEKTQVAYGIENVTALLLQFFSNAKSWFGVFANADGASVAMEFPPYVNAYDDFVNKRGGKMQWITEVTKNNVSYIRKLMKYADVRHMDDIKGTAFGVSETEYVATAVVQEAQPLAHLIYGNIRDIVEQQQYLFQNLWYKAMPAEQKIREIEEGVLPPETKVIEEPEQVYNRIVGLLENSSEVMIASTTGGLHLAHNQFFDIYKKLMAKKAKGEHKGIRWVMFIDKDNIGIVRTFLDTGVEIRHIRNMPPVYFALSDKIYNGTIETMAGGKMIQTLLTSTEQPYIQHFKSVFEELWSEGIDASERIRELEAGIDTETEVVINSSRIEQIYKDIVSSAKQEILLLLPTTGAFRREERRGVIAMLEQAASHGVKIRILLTSFRAESGDEELKIAKLKDQGIEAHAISRTITSDEMEEEGITKVTVIIADNKKTMAIELRDDSKDNFAEAIGPTVISTQKPLVSSFSRIFESLWNETKVALQLKEGDRLQKEFINIAAHELRTPVQPILGMADLIQSALGDKEKTEVTREDIAMIVRNAKRLERLSSDILEVARMESQSLDLHKEQFNLDEVVSDAIKNARDELNNGRVSVLYSSAGISVYADKARVSQVVQNLLSNAIKFTPRGSISIRLEEKGGQAIVAVQDTGKGIDPEILPKLFTKFATKSEKGTGLGLFISKSIIEAHGGTIWAENNKDKGATFSFSLPAD